MTICSLIKELFNHGPINLKHYTKCSITITAIKIWLKSKWNNNIRHISGSGLMTDLCWPALAQHRPVNKCPHDRSKMPTHVGVRAVGRMNRYIWRSAESWRAPGGHRTLDVWCRGTSILEETYSINTATSESWMIDQVCVWLAAIHNEKRTCPDQCAKYPT